MSNQGLSSVSRRALLGGAAIATTATAAGLLLAPQFRHRHPRLQPDGTYRKLRLGWAGAEHCPVFAAAQQKGFFAHYNLDIEVVSSSANGHETLDAMKNKAFDYAVASALIWIQYLNNAMPARLVLGVQPGNFRLLVRRSSGITRLDQLMGRTVAIPDRNAADKLFFAVMMRRKGLDAMNRITWQDMPFGQISEAAQAQKIEAVAAHDPYAWQLLHDHPDLFTELVGSNTGHYAERTSLVMGVSDAALAEDPAAATALVLALMDAAHWADTHRDEAATLIADDTPALSSDSARAMLHSEPLIRPVTGSAFRDQIAQYCDELQLIGLMPDLEDSAALAHNFTRNVLHA